MLSILSLSAIMSPMKRCGILLLPALLDMGINVFISGVVGWHNP